MTNCNDDDDNNDEDDDDNDGDDNDDGDDDTLRENWRGDRICKYASRRIWTFTPR